MIAHCIPPRRDADYRYFWEPTQCRFTTATLGDGWARLSARREIGRPRVDLNHRLQSAVATRSLALYPLSYKAEIETPRRELNPLGLPAHT